MIVFLGIILLILTFIQSLIGLKSDSSQDIGSRNNGSRILSYIYFIVLVVGILSFIFNETDKNKINNIVISTSLKIDSVNQILGHQINLVKQNLNNTYGIVDNIDSLNSVTSSILENESRLLDQYYVINKKLKSQLDLERMAIEERSAIIDLNRQKIIWDTSELANCKLKICVSNFGKRVGIIEKGKGYILLLNHENKIIIGVPIRGNAMNDRLQPNYIKDEAFCYFSDVVKGSYENLLSHATYAIIMLEVKYKDELILTSKFSKTYTIWDPSIGFGGPKQWQKNLAVNWEEDNYNFD